jgi:hypothetical protein
MNYHYIYGVLHITFLKYEGKTDETPQLTNYRPSPSVV